jgi:hypothetical protein
MTFDPDRRNDIDPVRRRMIEGEGNGWAPAIVGILLLAGFAYLIFGSWGPSVDQPAPRSAQVEKGMPAPATAPR